VVSRFGPDGADRLLAVVAWLLPPGRQDWGRAMRAELAALSATADRRSFAAGCLRVAVWPGQVPQVARFLVVVGAALALAAASGATAALRVELVGLGVAAPVVLWRLGRREAVVGAVGPTRTARVARRGILAVVVCGVVAGIETIAVTLPREGSMTAASGAVTGLTLVIVFLSAYTAAGFAATSAAAAVPVTTLAAAGGFGAAAGLGWCVLMPFDQTLSVPGPWRVAAYGLALALVVVAAPAGAAVLAVRRSGEPLQGVLAGAGTGGLAALIILAGGWATVRLAPWLLNSPLLNKGPQWRPPDVVEQVITSYLAILVVAPLIGALMGRLAVSASGGLPGGGLPGRRVRLATVSALAVAGCLTYPGINAAVATDRTAFGQVGSTTVAFSPAGATLLTSNGDNTWILWNVIDAAHPRRLATFSDDVRYSPDGRILASRDVLWSLADPTRPVRTADYLGGKPVAFSADGTLLATHRTPTTTTLWRLRGGASPTRLGTIAEGGDGAFTPGGHVFVARADTTTSLWDVTDPIRPIRLAVLAGTGRDPLSPDGGSLTTDTDAGIVLWSLTDPGHPRRIGLLDGTSDSDGATGQAVYSPDGHALAVGHRDGSVALFDTATGERTAALSPAPGHPNNDVQIGVSDTLTTVAYAPDGHHLSVITGNATVSLWDLTDPGRPVRTQVLTRNTRGAGQVAFSRDTFTVAGAAVDGSNSITVWSLR
jgi:WD40 repeat protein